MLNSDLPRRSRDDPSRQQPLRDLGHRLGVRPLHRSSPFIAIQPVRARPKVPLIPSPTARQLLSISAECDSDDCTRRHFRKMFTRPTRPAGKILSHALLHLR